MYYQLSILTDMNEYWKVIMQKSLFYILLMNLLISMVGCGNHLNTDPDGPGDRVVHSVIVTPNPIEVLRGKAQIFSAEVQGLRNPPQTVTWSVTSGTPNTNINSNTTISTSGILTVANAEPSQILVIRATSTFDTDFYGFAEVAVDGSIVTNVIITPSGVNVQRDGTLQFTAVVEGRFNPSQEVTWSVSGGGIGTNISATGYLTVSENEIAEQLTITAVSQDDPTKSSHAVISIPGVGESWDVHDVASWSAAVGGIRNGGNNKTHTINLTADVAVPFTERALFHDVSGIVVTINGTNTLSPSTVGNLLYIGLGQTVIVNNVTLRGRSDNNTAVVNIQSGATFHMKGNASVTGNSSNNSAGGVVVNGGNFIMQGNSTVSDNVHRDWIGTGGVLVNGGTFTMRDNASITRNEATQMWSAGGGVHVASGGNFIMEGGTISSNSSVSGGGVLVASGGSFTLLNGTITANTANGNGGGVHVGGLFNMVGGMISVNRAYGSGGGVYVTGSATWIKTSGTISGSDAAPLGNVASTNRGHVAFREHSPSLWRNTTAGPNDNPDDDFFWRNEQ
jgi:hypothetical protein